MCSCVSVCVCVCVCVAPPQQWGTLGSCRPRCGHRWLQCFCSVLAVLCSIFERVFAMFLQCFRKCFCNVFASEFCIVFFALILKSVFAVFHHSAESTHSRSSMQRPTDCVRVVHVCAYACVCVRVHACISKWPKRKRLVSHLAPIAVVFGTPPEEGTLQAARTRALDDNMCSLLIQFRFFVFPLFFVY